MIELPEPNAYQGRRYSTDADDPGWETWITLSVDEVKHWKNLIAAGYKREVRELIATDQLRTYGDQRAAEAREQMRDELIAHWKKQKFMTLNPEDSAQNQRVQGMKSCNQNYIEYLEKLK